ncbi:MAG: hypothetical protein OES24_12300 [Acidimicrobiia bacterium]|nr:hypothetical protein [Acidimicrobiia bacterium]
MSDSSSSPGSRPPANRLGSAPLVGVAGLERLTAAVDGLRAGIVELEQLPSFLMLGDAEPGTVTASDYATAVRQAGDFWPLLDVLTGRIDEARRLVDRHGLSPDGGSSRRVDELNQLLAAPLTVTLTDGARTLSTASALSLLRQRYDAVHQGVSRIDRAWLDVLPRVEAARETADRLASEADALGVVEPLIGRVRSRAEDLAERLLSDPISVDESEGRDLDRLVADAARQMANLRTGHDNLGEDLARTEEVLASLRVLRTRAAAAAEEARHKIVDPQDLVTVPARTIVDGPGGLAEQLDDLLSLAGDDTPAATPSSAWTRQRTLLDQWLAMADRLERQLVEAERRNRRDLDRRDELRGRLQAFQAKMAATGNAESPTAMELADGAWTELYTAPSDLDAAEAAIVQLADELRKP